MHVTPVVDYTHYDWDSPAPAAAAFTGSCSGHFPTRLPTHSTAPMRRNSLPCAPSRPLRSALELLNHPFVLRQCQAFAERLARLTPKLESQLAAAFELAYARPAAADELRELGAYAARYGLINACRLIFNSNEFLYVN